MPDPKTPLFIDGQEPLPKAQDWKTLVEEGRERLQRLAGEVWTDYNEHDPGVTLLEALAYALTDLGYRAERSAIPDLLTDERGELDRHGACLYPPEQIFPTAPVTLMDLRKVLLDELPNLANVWLLPVAPEPQHRPVPGRYRVWVLPALPDGGDTLVDAVKQCSSRYRPLGEVFEQVDVVVPVPLRFTLELRVATGCDPVRLVHDARTAVSHELCPPITFQPREGPLAPALPPEALYEGPLLSRGVLLDEQLWTPPGDAATHEEQLRRRVTHALLMVDGIEQVCSLKIDGIPPARPSRPDDMPCVFQWDERAGAQHLFHLHWPGGAKPKRFTWPEEPERTGDTPRPARAASAQAPLPRWERLVPAGNFLDVGHYDSVQAQLPAIYGLEKDALGPDAPPQRLAQAQQLRAYLFVFEQILANAFAQLAHLPRLLTWRKERKERKERKDPTPYVFQPYVCQPLYALEGAQALLWGAPTPEPGAQPRLAADAWQAYTEDPNNPYAAGLAATAAEWSRVYGQPEALLDHLLARFGESMPRLDWRNFETPEQKRYFLEHYPELSTNRTLGFDVVRALRRPASESASESASDNASALERKMDVMLAAGARNLLRENTGPGRLEGRSYYLVEHPLLVSTLTGLKPLPPRGQDGKTEARETAEVPRDFFIARLSHVLANWTCFPTQEGFHAYVDSFILESAPAHLCSTFIWIDDDSPEMRRFRQLIESWYEQGLPQLDVLGTRGDALVVTASGPAYELVQWLLENARTAASGGSA